MPIIPTARVVPAETQGEGRYLTAKHQRAEHGTGFGAESEFSQRYHEPGSCFPKLTKAVCYLEQDATSRWQYPSRVQNAVPSKV